MSSSKTLSAFVISLMCLLAAAPKAFGDGNTTTTTLAVSSNSVSAGTAITLTATVTGQIPVTAGQVMFCDASASPCDGAALFGVAQVTSSNTATITLTLGVGAYSINAVFAGSSQADSSASSPQALTVTGAANYVSGTAISASGTSSAYTLTGKVTAFGKATTTATVSFLDTSNSNAAVASAALDPTTLATVFNQAPGAPLSIPVKVQYVVSADFDHDGIPDLAVIDGRNGVGHVFIYLGNGDGSFQTAVSYNVGSLAQALTVADLNGDGNPDLIVANESSGTISVLLGNANGTFQAQVTYATGTLPIFVAAGDFNGDGWPDLAVVNTGSSTVGILLNHADGTGTFQAQVTYPTGTSSRGVAVGDFNNDGILDLAITDHNVSFQPVVSIYPGVGNGTFGVRQDVALPVSAFAGYLVAGDLKHNGTLDLAVPDLSTSNVYVLLGNNDGTFQAAATYTLPQAALAAALGDVDGDGVLDLVVADTGADGQVSVLRGLGDGSFGTRADYTVGNFPNNAVLADFNGDGLLDIATSDTGPHTTSVLLQARTETAIATGVVVIGAGTHNVLASFPGDTDRAPSQSTTVALAGVAPTSTATALVAAPNPGYTGSPVVLTATVSPTPTGGSLGTVSFFDGATLLGTANVNALGVAVFSVTNLAVGAHSLTAVYSGNLAFVTSTSSAVSESVSASSATTTSLTLSSASVASGTPVTLTAAVLVGSTPVTSGTVLYCDATAALCADTALLGTAQMKPNGTALLKLTFGVGQYSIDAVYEATNPDQRSVSAAQALTVTGNGGYPSTTTIAASGSAGNYTLAGTVGAFGKSAFSGNVSFLDTSNGNAVVAAAGFDPTTLTYGIVPASGSPLDEGSGPFNVVTGDFNNDGILDFATVDNNDPTVSVYLGIGDGTFAAAVTYPIDDLGVDIKVGDFNGDGKLDIVTANGYENTTLSVLLGNGDGTFQTEVPYTAGDSPSGIAVGDLNHDGILDLAVANNDGPGSVSILLGNSDGTFQTQVKYPAGLGPFYIASADFNGDGILDLATANIGDGTVTVLLGNGDGSFQLPVPYAAGGSPDYILVADVNNDGKPDLVVANYDDDTLSVYLGNGDGTFQPQLISATSSGPNDLAVGDFNADGKLDIAVTNNNSVTVSILFGDGLGNFGATQLTVDSGDVPWGIAVGDFNGDGLPDLVATNNSDDTVSVFLNQKSEVATATGVAVFPTGTHNVLANYPGDASRTTSQSATVALAGSALTATATTLVAAPNPANVGQSVTLTATVSPAPTGLSLGTVNFSDGATLLGSGSVDSSGVATFSTSGLQPGVHNLTAVYSGNSGFMSSTSVTFPETILALTSTTTALVALPNPATVGQTVTLTATVSPAPTGSSLGTVSFCDASIVAADRLTKSMPTARNGKVSRLLSNLPGGGNPCGSGTLLGTLTVDSSGVATLTTATLAVGAHSLTAIYSGNVAFAGSTSTPVTENINPLTSTTTTLTAVPNPAIAGQTVTLTATVSPAPTGLSLGTVSFCDGGVGPNLLMKSMPTAGGGKVNRLLANSPGGGGNPCGSGTLLGTLTVDSSGVATLTTATLAVGAHSLTAIYSGNSAFAGSTSTPGTENINPLTTTTTALVAAPNPANLGQTVILTATVTPAPTGSSLGTISFSDGATLLGSGSLNSSGVATFSTTALALGGHNLTAAYSGNATFAASTSVIFAETINAVLTATTTGLVATPNPAIVGQTVTLTATVSPTPTGLPLGTVSFCDGAVGLNPLTKSMPIASNGKVSRPLAILPDGGANPCGSGTLLGTLTVDSSGVATLTTATLAVGAHSITAVYSGNVAFSGSTSSTVTQNVNALTATTTTLTVAPNPAVVGQAVTLTATVSPDPTGSSLGTVTFYDGETLLGSGNLNSSGVATFSSTSLAVSTHSLTAIYSGNAGFAGSTSNTVSEAITTPISTTTTLSTAPNPVDDGQPVTLTATVSPAPTGSSLGTVSFFNGSTLLGTGTLDSSGVATFSSPSLPAGILSLTAVYSGNAGFAASTSLAFTETVNPGFTVTAPLAPVTVAEGGAVDVNVTVPPLGGAFDQPVVLSATGLPPGATASFNPAIVTPGASGAPTVMTIQLAKLAAGVFGKERRIPARQFLFASLFMAACCLTGMRRKRLPAQFRLIAFFAVLAFAAMTTVGCGGGFLSPPTTHPGQYVVTITGTSGSAQSSTTVTVVVQ